MILIDEPRYVESVEYSNSISAVVSKLKLIDGVKSVYQIGGISSLGISDIDIVVVFEDGVICKENPLDGLSYPGSYLFVHNLLAAPISLFRESHEFIYFHNFRHLYGEKDNAILNLDIERMDALLQRQLANEYLVRMLANMTVEKEFGIFKLRGLLLHGNALKYDLEYLGIKDTDLNLCVDQILTWRKDWFSMRPDNKVVLEFFGFFYQALVDFLNRHFATNPLYFPPLESHVIGRNITFKQADYIKCEAIGPKLGWVPVRFARKLISLQHRFNQFTIELPFQTENVPAQVAKSFDYSTKAREYNQKHLPHFMPLTSSLAFNLKL